MAMTLPELHESRHPNNLRMRPKPAKACLDVPNSLRKQDGWHQDAEDCREANRLSRMEDKDIAVELGFKSPSQMSDQLAARERPQTERWRSSPRLYAYYLIAQLQRNPDLFEEIRTFKLRRPL